MDDLHAALALAHVPAERLGLGKTHPALSGEPCLALCNQRMRLLMPEWIRPVAPFCGRSNVAPTVSCAIEPSHGCAHGTVPASSSAMMVSVIS